MATAIDGALFGDTWSSADRRGAGARRPHKSLLLADPRGAPRLTEAELDAVIDPVRFAGLAGRVGKYVTGPETRGHWGPA